jgi:gliding motility-associated lipoprotein GldH
MKRIALCLLAFVLFSCSKKEAVYTDTFKDFDENRWKLEDMKTFTPVLNEDVKDVSLSLHFSHVFEPGYDKIPVAVIFQDPDGKEENLLVEVKLKNEAGKSLSDCAGDVCDIVVPVKEHVDLAKGKYKVTFLNKADSPYVPNVLSVGLSIAKGE